MASGAGRLQILSLAIIGKQGEPLYVRNFTSQSGGQAHLKWHYAAHVSLDVFDERDALPTTLLDCYFGLLYTLENYACYGYQSNTRIRFVLCLSIKDTLIKDVEVKMVFKALHGAYIRFISNPFFAVSVNGLNPNAITPAIKSKKFDQEINRIISL